VLRASSRAALLTPLSTGLLVMVMWLLLSVWLCLFVCGGE
jgi:hypothetical protein